MKKISLFVILTITITTVNWLLVGVLIGAPEPWEHSLLTPWQNIAGILMLITYLPSLVVMILSHFFGWDMPAASIFPLIIFSAVVWAAIIMLAWDRATRKQTPTPPA